MKGFRSVHVEGKNLDETWFELLRQLYYHGRRYKIDAGSFAGAERLEFDMVSGTIQEPIQYTEGGVRLPLAVSVPQGIPAPTSDEAIENYFVEYLMNSELKPNEHYRYSTWLRGGRYAIPKLALEGLRQEGPAPAVIVPDQVQWCLDHYKRVGFGNNHCCIAVGYPESNLAYDQAYTNEMERGTSPCLRIVDTKIVKEDGENYLCMNVYFRSWDCYGGWPENMGGLALVQEYMAQDLGVRTGSLSVASKGLHAYDFQIEALKGRIGV
ncbi:MAG: thymidylate synthase [Desulfobaccales bacterium]